jgi:hypothetical protein
MVDIALEFLIVPSVVARYSHAKGNGIYAKLPQPDILYCFDRRFTGCDM